MARRFEKRFFNPFQKYEADAARDKERYASQMQSYVPPADDSDSGDDSRKKKKRKAAKAVAKTEAKEVARRSRETVRVGPLSV